MKSSKKSKELPAELLADFAKLSLATDPSAEESKSDEKDCTDLVAVSKPASKLDGSLCFLGTGSMIPLPSRTVSAILIERTQGNILLDCGEGTYS